MRRRPFLIVCWTAALAGCATSAPVLELADKTSANVGVLSAQLRQLATESDQLYTQRVNNISQLAGVNARARAQLTYDLALTRKVGQQSDIDTANDLQAWKQEVDQIFADAASAEKQRHDELLGKQTRLDVKGQALQQVAAALSTLASKESPAERAQAIAKFATATRGDIKSDLDSGTQSAAEAKALLDQIKGKASNLLPK
jgi:hypothetical protein